MSARLPAIAILCLLLAGCLGSGGDDERLGPDAIRPVEGAGDGPPLTIGSKNFTEQFILGEIYAQALEAAGFRVERRLDLGSEIVANEALTSGRIDAYPEYVGTALTSFFDLEPGDVPPDPRAAYERAREGYAENDLTALPPTAFENSYRLGMTKARAAEAGDPEAISDLAGEAAQLTVSGFPECRQRQDCLLGVEETYGLNFGGFVASEERYAVLDSGKADVSFIFTTDGELASGRYVVLDDDEDFFPPYNVTFVMRDEALARIGPAGRKALEAVQAPLTAQVMRELNARVDVRGQTPGAAARAYLERSGFVPRG